MGRITDFDMLQMSKKNEKRTLAKKIPYEELLRIITYRHACRMKLDGVMGTAYHCDWLTPLTKKILAKYQNVKTMRVQQGGVLVFVGDKCFTCK